MSEMDHLGSSLSAYLDGAVDPATRADVNAHLSTCATCRTRLEELRATARLIAALPAARPSRSLVPQLAVAPGWARPVRSLASIASGLFVFIFIASAALSTGLGGGGAGSLLRPAGAPAASANVFSNISNNLSAPQAPAAASAGVRAAGGQPATAAPAPTTQFTLASAPPKAVEDASATAAPHPVTSVSGYSPPQPLASPWPWLVLAVLSAAVAIFAHRRARVR